MDLKLKGKTALVMGSSQGIGKAIAESLIQEGAKVALCSRSEESLKKTQAEIGAETYFACDLSKPGESRAVTQKAIEAFGNLDILITNTGGPAKGSFIDISEEQWLTDYQSLWMSAVESFRVALPVMKKNGFGRIIMITSLAAKEPIAGLTTSNALRAGLEGMAKNISNEYAADGITVNLILPGYTDTERLRELNLSDDKVKQIVPAGRLGKPSELGDLAAFLASERAGYINAQNIVIDGGALKGHY